MDWCAPPHELLLSHVRRDRQESPADRDPPIVPETEDEKAEIPGCAGAAEAAAGGEEGRSIRINETCLPLSPLELPLPRHLARRPALAFLRPRFVKPLTLELDLGDEAFELTRAELIRDRRNQSLHQRDTLGQGELVRIIHELAQHGMIIHHFTARRHRVSRSVAGVRIFMMPVPRSRLEPEVPMIAPTPPPSASAARVRRL